MYNQYPGQEQPKSSSKLWIIILVVVLAFACLSVTFIGGCMAAIIVPNFIKARSHGQLAACESNMKNIATALEMYATDNKGYYPPSLDYLTGSESGNLMKNMPICPSCQKSYIYTATNAGKHSVFTLQCGGMNAHQDTGQVGQGNFPKYTPEKGLELK